jgi:hypothetical protein
LKPKHEVILKRNDKSRVKIVVSFSPTRRYDEYEYRVQVWHCLPRKRKFFDTHKETWEFQKMSMEDRQEHILLSYWDYVTVEEVEAVKLALWEKLRPETGR